MSKQTIDAEEPLNDLEFLKKRNSLDSSLFPCVANFRLSVDFVVALLNGLFLAGAVEVVEVDHTIVLSAKVVVELPSARSRH